MHRVPLAAQDLRPPPPPPAEAVLRAAAHAVPRALPHVPDEAAVCGVPRGVCGRVRDTPFLRGDGRERGVRWRDRHVEGEDGRERRGEEGVPVEVAGGRDGRECGGCRAGDRRHEGVRRGRAAHEPVPERGSLRREEGPRGRLRQFGDGGLLGSMQLQCSPFHRRSRCSACPSPGDARPVDFRAVHVAAQVAAGARRGLPAAVCLVAHARGHGTARARAAASRAPGAQADLRQDPGAGCRHPCQDQVRTHQGMPRDKAVDGTRCGVCGWQLRGLRRHHIGHWLQKQRTRLAKGEGDVLRERWSAEEALPQRMERGEGAICRGVHKARSAGCIHGRKEDCAGYRTVLEVSGEASPVLLFPIKAATAHDLEEGTGV